MSQPPYEKADYDSPWKDIIRQLFEPFMRFFFPLIHVQIDWSKGYSFQAKEFQKIAYDAATGRRTISAKLRRKCIEISCVGRLWSGISKV